MLAMSCLLAACSPAPSGATLPVTEWDCPAIDCGTLDGTAVCASGVCVNPPTEASVRALVRLPTNTSVAPGVTFVATPLTSIFCEGCVSRPASYTTEQGVVLTVDAARSIGLAAATDVVVPARVTLEPLIDGAYAMNDVLPRPLAPMTLERWPRALTSTSWRGPGGGPPETSRAVLFEGRYARKVDPEAPYDAIVPPILDTLTLPGGVQMVAVGAGQLVPITIEHLELPARAGGWELFLVDAKGARRSTRVSLTSSAGPVTLRIDTAQTPDPLLLDLVVAPTDARIDTPRLVVPAPTALRRIAYPSFAGTSRVNVRALDEGGKALPRTRITFALRSLEAAFGTEGEVFAAYARAETGVTTNDAGLAVLQVPFGSYDAFARVSVDGVLRGTRTLTYTFNAETATATFRPIAPRVLSGTCVFAGGKPLAGADIEARSIDASALPYGFSRTKGATDANGVFRIELPEGAFAFWLHPPMGAPMADQFLGVDASANTRLSQIDCRLRAPVRRTLTVLDGMPQASAPVPSAIVETLRLRAGAPPLWLGEGISAADGKAVVYEAP